MEELQLKFETKNAIKKEFTIINISIICFCLILIIIRWINIFNKNIVFINNEVTSHISNFSLSMILYVYCGEIMLFYDVKFKHVILLGISLILGNFACELFLSFLNTKDILDAVYGLIGCILPFPYLMLTKRLGIVPNNKNIK